MQLDAIKTTLFGQLNTLSEILFRFFNIFRGHCFWNIMRNVQTTVIITDRNLGRSKRLKASSGLFDTCPAAVEDLQKEFTISCMDCVYNFFPSIRLFLIEKTTSAWEALSSLGPCCSLGQYHTSTRPL